MNQPANGGLKRFARRAIGSVLSLGLLAAVAAPAWAAPADTRDSSTKAPEWIYPVIKVAGGVHPRPDLPIRPDPKVDYHIFVDMVSSDRDPAGQYSALIRLSRLVNLMAYAKVPSSHVHIVALFDGEVGYAAATNDFYRHAFNADNPNLAIVHALKKAGVELLVCSQALAENDLPDSAVDPDITITLSALMDAVVYGQRGYIYMQL
jgi:intracellular sulfur oxidation DsrE/DsrF family protein